MNGLRFKAGELAIFICPAHQSGVGHEGTQVVVASVGPFRTGEDVLVSGVRIIATYDFDYVIDWPEGMVGFIRDWQLRKLDPPAEPESITRREEVEA